MVRAKRSCKLKRIKKFILKNNPSITAHRFEHQIERLAYLLKIWLAVQEWSEQETIDYLNNIGIPPEQQVFYIAYTKQQINRALLFEIYSMLKELNIRADIWEKRGLVREILQALQQPQEKYGAIYSAFVSYLKNAYADYCFCDYCVCW